MVDRPSSAHGKLHKRNASDTIRLPLKSPTMPSPMIGRPSLDFKRKVTYEEPPPSSPSASSLKIKPYVRKTSGKESAHVDLSRSMAENESLTGLGLGIDESNYSSSYTLGARSASDVSFTPVRGHRHRRSTSGNSHISITSTGLRQQPSTYTNPLRQAPRPYTPPVSKSYTSTAGSGSGNSDDNVIEEIPRPVDESEALRRLMSNSSSEPFGRKSESISNFPSFEASTPQPLQQRTSDLSVQFASPSQTSLGDRSRRATLQSVDTISPSSRPSLDKALNFVRGQRSNGTDTELIEHESSHAASIRAARLAYQEREAAKDRKAEKEELKQAEREQKKQHKKDDRKRRKSEARDPPNQSREAISEKDASIGGGDYASLRPESSGPQPSRVERAAPSKQSQRRSGEQSGRQMKKKRGPKSTWAIFLAWFRTRLLRMGG